MFDWFRRLFSSRPTTVIASVNKAPLPSNTIRLAAERDYRGPEEVSYSNPSEADTYRSAHRAGWEFFAQGSYYYLSPDGRPNGEILGRGACERDYGSEPEQAGFAAGFEQARKLLSQRLREAIHAHFADSDPAPDRDGE